MTTLKRADVACPRCGHQETRVKDSRGVVGASQINRRRLCISCGCKFSTQERVTPDYSGELDTRAITEKIARAQKSIGWLESLLLEIRRELDASA